MRPTSGSTAGSWDAPVIDTEGHVRDIAIASGGHDEAPRGPTSVLPSHIVKHVVLELIEEGKDNQ